MYSTVIVYFKTNGTLTLGIKRGPGIEYSNLEDLGMYRTTQCVFQNKWNFNFGN
jgi:hypothetical protein